MNRIERNVYVLRDDIKQTIEYVQGADAIPIKFTVKDYNIASGSTARVYVKKPSGKAVYNNASITGNTITVNTDKQMYAEHGKAELQIEVKKAEKTLLTFAWPITVRKSIIPIKSENGSNFIDEYLQRINTAIAQATAVKEEIERMAANGDFSATVNVGSTTTGSPGTYADVTNIGTIKDAVFSFTIPQGRPGISTSIAPGIFEMYVNADGNLVMRHNDNETTPPFTIRDGELIYTIS